MLKIRLQRIGRRNNPSYRVVVVDSTTAAKKGKPVELLGTHDTVRKQTSLNNERILYWMSQGAQVSDTMHNILIKNGVIEGVKINVLPKKNPIKKEESDESVAETSAGAESEQNTISSGEESDTDNISSKKEDAEDSQEPPPQEQQPNTPSTEG